MLGRDTIIILDNDSSQKIEGTSQSEAVIRDRNGSTTQLDTRNSELNLPQGISGPPPYLLQINDFSHGLFGGSESIRAIHWNLRSVNIDTA